MDSKWVEWTKKLQAIAQNGLTFAQDKYDLERYRQLREITAEIIASYSDHNFPEVMNYLSKETGYMTPKVDVRGVVFSEDKLLFVKEILDSRWTLPGGWADVCASPKENVEREVFEESGFEVQATRLLAVYDRSRHGHVPEFPHHVYKMFFLCEVTGGSPQLSMETNGVEFFGLDGLPELSVSRITEKQIRRMYELRDLRIVDVD